MLIFVRFNATICSVLLDLLVHAYAYREALRFDPLYAGLFLCRFSAG